MSSPSVLATPPPPEVITGFLRLLGEAIDAWFGGGEPVPFLAVLRGSFLLQHWCGDRARPAGDLDLECFPNSEEPQGEEVREWMEYEEFESLVDQCKALSRYSAEESRAYRWGSDRTPPRLEFLPDPNVPENESLWVYGTPGERYYTGFLLRTRPEQRGLLQIDIAEHAGYTFEEIGRTELTLKTFEDDTPFPFSAYSPEMLLAAKLSWLFRGLTRRLDGETILTPKWSGELKDLFDAHLIFSELDPDPAAVRKCLGLVGRDDDFSVTGLRAVFDARRDGMTTDDFPRWLEFASQYPTQATTDPVTMLRGVADGLERVLGSTFVTEELPFLLTIEDDRADELPQVMYADWLDDAGDPRGEFLRTLTGFLFHRDEMTEAQQTATAVRLRNEQLDDIDEFWFQMLCGQGSRAKLIREAIDSIAGPSANA